MKCGEIHFDEYLQPKTKLHPKLAQLYDTFPSNVCDFKNVIFYGPPGCGKYTQMLQCIQKYSPSRLKYEKKITVVYNQQPNTFKISDIHYEVDMSLLGCNSKVLWHEIFQTIVDIINATSEKTGIIVCKCFHKIHNELLDNFYSYMEKPMKGSNLSFILITENISFIPDNICECCEIIPVERPTKSAYSKCGIKIPKNWTLDNIVNIKMMADTSPVALSDVPSRNTSDRPVPARDTSDRPVPARNPNHKITCDKLLKMMLSLETFQYLQFRDTIYDVFIYNLDIGACLGYILVRCIEQKKIPLDRMDDVYVALYCFFHYFNNNYRSIYHMEKYLLQLMKIIHRL